MDGLFELKFACIWLYRHGLMYQPEFGVFGEAFQYGTTNAFPVKAACVNLQEIKVILYCVVQYRVQVQIGVVTTTEG